MVFCSIFLGLLQAFINPSYAVNGDQPAEPTTAPQIVDSDQQSWAELLEKMNNALDQADAYLNSQGINNVKGGCSVSNAPVHTKPFNAVIRGTVSKNEVALGTPPQISSEKRGSLKSQDQVQRASILERLWKTFVAEQRRSSHINEAVLDSTKALFLTIRAGLTTSDLFSELQSFKKGDFSKDERGNLSFKTTFPTDEQREHLLTSLWELEAEARHIRPEDIHNYEVASPFYAQIAARSTHQLTFDLAQRLH